MLRDVVGLRAAVFRGAAGWRKGEKAGRREREK